MGHFGLGEFYLFGLLRVGWLRFCDCGAWQCAYCV